jgi:hypothetical protein
VPLPLCLFWPVRFPSCFHRLALLASRPLLGCLCLLLLHVHRQSIREYAFHVLIFSPVACTFHPSEHRKRLARAAQGLLQFLRATYRQQLGGQTRKNYAMNALRCYSMICTPAQHSRYMLYMHCLVSSVACTLHPSSLPLTQLSLPTPRGSSSLPLECFSLQSSRPSAVASTYYPTPCLAASHTLSFAL